jgi:hypothetical protein
VNLSHLTYVLRSHLRSPDVIVDFACEKAKLFVVIKNIGDGPAHHVSTEFEPELQGAQGTRDVSALPLFEHLAFLAPEREIRVFVDTVSAYLGRDAPTKISATVRFEDDGGTRHERTICHDLRVYRGLEFSSAWPQEDAASPN